MESHPHLHRKPLHWSPTSSFLDHLYYHWFQNKYFKSHTMYPTNLFQDILEKCYHISYFRFLALKYVRIYLRLKNGNHKKVFQYHQILILVCFFDFRYIAPLTANTSCDFMWMVRKHSIYFLFLLNKKYHNTLHHDFHMALFPWYCEEIICWWMHGQKLIKPNFPFKAWVWSGLYQWHDWKFHQHLNYFQTNKL